MNAWIREGLERIKNNPALLAATVSALIAIFLAFGVPLTDEQVGAIMAFVTVIAGWIVRSQVTPTRKVAAKEDEDSPVGDLVAGPASELPDDSPVDVVPAEDVYGQRDPL